MAKHLVLKAVTSVGGIVALAATVGAGYKW
jgi:hypothetical protein